MLKDFRDFAFRGNMIDLAVGLILGAAFSTVVKSLVDDLIMPLIGKIAGGKDFSNFYVPLDGQPMDQTLAVAREGGAVIAWGSFVNHFVTFLIVSWIIFLIVEKVMKAIKKSDAAPAPEPPGPTREEVLLTEIRDLLKARN